MRHVLIIFVLLILGGCLDQYPHAPTSPNEQRAVDFVTSLVNPSSGLVASRPGECFTTVYKNSLAAMVFLHQGNHHAAEAILDRFDEYLTKLSMMMNPLPFRGFPKDWDACTGEPTNENYWEGDNAFLLLALNYHSSVSRNTTKYKQLRSELVSWLVQRSMVCETIVAEGTANMYAALIPHSSDPAVAQALTHLKACFEATVDYAQVLDHTVRGALVFNNLTGFDHVDKFQRTETWVYNNIPIEAYSAFSGESFINVEISAQLSLTATLTDRGSRVPKLRFELEKLWLTQENGRQAGLPYFITNVGFDQSATLPIIDPTAYMLFGYWKFNPFTGQ